jgi:YD repeat-containing protein
VSAPSSPSRPADAGRATPRADEVVREVALPGGGVRREHYDFLGTLRLCEEPDGSWLRYRYGREGRLERVEHSTGEYVEIAFDAATNEWSARTPRTEVRVRLSDEGLPLESLHTIDGASWSIGYRRDAWGRVEAWRYPGSAEWTRPEQYLTIERDVAAQRVVVRFSNGAVAEEEMAGDLLQRITVRDAGGAAVVDAHYDYDSIGRLERAGPGRVSYTTAGQLGGWNSRSYAYDHEGRFVEVRSEAGTTRLEYDGGPMVRRAGAVEFAYDACGRRTARTGPRGTTRYRYNMFGQLAEAETPDGRIVHYLYDGFGRLVARTADGTVAHYITDLDGHRLAEADGSGLIVRSYVWLGPSCIGRCDGLIGGELACSFHRLHSGWLAAVGDSCGRLRRVSLDDPFGAATPIEDGVPGYAGLFGDPHTSLLHAGSRWLDPETAQFLTPDSWAGLDVARRLPARVRRVIRSMPGGPGRPLSPVTSYAWCAYDPVNFNDPTGHSWAGFILPTLSAFLWEVNLTNIAYQMELINVVWTVLLFVIGGSKWAPNVFRTTSIFNTLGGAASSRQHVWAFVLNGLLNVSSVAWTLGSVIWARGTEFQEIEEEAQRDLLICPGAGASYKSALGERTADTIRALSTTAVMSGQVQGVDTSPAGGGVLDNVAVTTPAGGLALADVLRSGDWIAISPPPGVSRDEVRRVATVVAPNVIQLDGPPLAAGFTPGGAPPALTVTRLDQGVVKIVEASHVVARTVVFVRGDAVHIPRQVPKEFGKTIAVDEYFPAGIPRRLELSRRPSFPLEPIILRKAKTANWNGYPVGTFVRIQSGKAFFPRMVVRIRGTDDLVLDRPLPEDDYKNLKIAPMATRALGVPVAPPNTRVANQAVVGAPSIVSAGDNVNGLKDLLPRLGLEIRNAAGDAERRLVTDLAVRCQTDPINLAALVGADIEADDVRPAGRPVRGKTDGGSALEIVTDHGKATTFSPGAPVRVTNKANANLGFSVVDHVDPPHDKVFLTEALPAADFGTPNTDVEIDLLKPVKKHTARQLAAAGDPLIVVVATAATPGASVKQGEIVRIRLKGNANGGVVRRIQGAPTILVTLDTALPASHAAVLDVIQFEPGAAGTERSGVSAPATRLRLAIPVGTPVPYAAADILWIRGRGEEAWAEVDHVTGQDVFFREMIDVQGIRAPVTVMRLEATGQRTPNATMDQGRVLVPSDPSVELTRPQALKEHELRHVRQGAAWGPLLLSAPIPWLVSSGVALFGGAAGGSKVTRWLKVGGLYSAIAEVLWGIGTGFDDSTIVAGAVTDRKTIVLAADAGIDKVATFAQGAHVQIFEGGKEGANVVDRLDTASRTLTLKRELEDDIATGASVRVGFDPLEEWRQRLGNFPFALNTESLWDDCLPATWLKLLSKVLNGQEWLPGLGVYPLAWFMARADRDRIPAEQDAAYHSGDLYNTIVLSDPGEVFVGEFSRLFTFVHIRNSGISREVRYVGAGIEGRIHLRAAAVDSDVEILTAGVINRFRADLQPIVIRDPAKPTKEVYAWVTAVSPAARTITLDRHLSNEFPDLRNVRVSFLTYAATGGLSRLAVELPVGVTDGKAREVTRREIEITRTSKDQGVAITRDEMATRFFAFQSIRITAAGHPPEFAVIESIKSGEHRIVLRDPLPNVFAAGTDVEVVVLVDDADVPESFSEIVSINGEMNGASLKEIKFPTLRIAPFAKKDPVRILRAGDAHNLAIPAEVESVDDLDLANDRIVLKKALPATFVAGTPVRVLGCRVTFREDRRFKMKDRVENVVGFLFRAVRPGVYTLIAPETPTKELVWKRGFDVDFLKLARVRVKPLEITTSLKAPLFETEQLDLKIKGKRRNYDVELVPIPGGDAGSLNRLTYTAPRLAAGVGTLDVEFRVFTRYAANDPILGRAGVRGQAEPLQLRPDELRLLCQQFKLTIHNLDGEARALPSIRAGQTASFQVPIAPSDIQVAPLRGPGSTRDGFVTPDGKRPSKLVFHAPDRVTASTNVTIALFFGHDPDPAKRKRVPITITVDP